MATADDKRSHHTVKMLKEVHGDTHSKELRPPAHILPWGILQPQPLGSLAGISSSLLEEIPAHPTSLILTNRNKIHACTRSSNFRATYTLALGCLPERASLKPLWQPLLPLPRPPPRRPPHRRRQSTPACWESVAVGSRLAGSVYTVYTRGAVQRPRARGPGEEGTGQKGAGVGQRKALKNRTTLRRQREVGLRVGETDAVEKEQEGQGEGGLLTLPLHSSPTLGMYNK